MLRNLPHSNFTASRTSWLRYPLRDQSGCDRGVYIQEQVIQVEHSTVHN